ncbi:hypothetical protein ENROMA047B_20505 [Enterobacter rongchengensis]
MKTDKAYSDTIKRDVEVDVVPCWPPSMRSASQKSAAPTTIRTASSSTEGTITPIVSWPKPSSLIFTTLACRKPIGRTKKIPVMGMTGIKTCLCKKHLKIRYTRKSDVRATLSPTNLSDKHIFLG